MAAHLDITFKTARESLSFEASDSEVLNLFKSLLDILNKERSKNFYVMKGTTTVSAINLTDIASISCSGLSKGFSLDLDDL